MAIKLVRRRDNKLMANRPLPNWEGWQPEYVQNRLKTIVGVSFMQTATVVEWVTKTGWRFDSRHPTMHLGLMWELVMSAYRREVFRYTDLEGGAYPVQVASIVEPSRDARILTYSQYELGVELVRLGYSE